jgi:hypothetical protein
MFVLYVSKHAQRDSKCLMQPSLYVEVHLCKNHLSSIHSLARGSSCPGFSFITRNRITIDFALSDSPYPL